MGFADGGLRVHASRFIQSAQGHHAWCWLLVCFGRFGNLGWPVFHLLSPCACVEVDWPDFHVDCHVLGVCLPGKTRRAMKQFDDGSLAPAVGQRHSRQTQ